VHYTARLEAAVAQECEAAPVHRIAAQRGLPPETVRRMDKRVLRRWANLDGEERQTLRELFALNRRLAKAYLLKEQLAQLWTYTYQGAAHRFLTNWLLALRWQRLPAFEKLGALVMRHLTGILNYCHEKVPFGKVEAINGNIRAMLRRGRGYRDHEYLLLKVQKATASRRLRQAA
jgi:transposase